VPAQGFILARGCHREHVETHAAPVLPAVAPRLVVVVYSRGESAQRRRHGARVHLMIRRSEVQVHRRGSDVCAVRFEGLLVLGDAHVPRGVVGDVRAESILFTGDAQSQMAVLVEMFGYFDQSCERTFFPFHVVDFGREWGSNTARVSGMGRTVSSFAVVGRSASSSNAALSAERRIPESLLCGVGELMVATPTLNDHSRVEKNKWFGCLRSMGSMGAVRGMRRSVSWGEWTNDTRDMYVGRINPGLGSRRSSSRRTRAFPAPGSLSIFSHLMTFATAELMRGRKARPCSLRVSPRTPNATDSAGNLSKGPDSVSR